MAFNMCCVVFCASIGNRIWGKKLYCIEHYSKCLSCSATYDDDDNPLVCDGCEGFVCRNEFCSSIPTADHRNYNAKCKSCRSGHEQATLKAVGSHVTMNFVNGVDEGILDQGVPGIEDNEIVDDYAEDATGIQELREHAAMVATEAVNKVVLDQGVPGIEDNGIIIDDYVEDARVVQDLREHAAMVATEAANTVVLDQGEPAVVDRIIIDEDSSVQTNLNEDAKAIPGLATFIDDLGRRIQALNLSTVTASPTSGKRLLGTAGVLVRHRKNTINRMNRTSARESYWKKVKNEEDCEFCFSSTKTWVYDKIDYLNVRVCCRCFKTISKLE